MPERTLDERCLVLGVQMSLDGMKADDATEYWRFAVSLVEGAQYFETWQKFWRVTPNTGSAQSGSGTVGPPVGGGGGGSGGTSTTRFGPVYFGGSRIAWMAGAGWQAIPGFVDVLIDPAGGLTQILVRCQSWVLAAGMTVQVRLVSVSGTPVGIGAAVSATSATDAGAFQEFTATLLGTAQYYRLEAQVTGTSGEGAVAGVVALPAGRAPCGGGADGGHPPWRSGRVRGRADAAAGEPAAAGRAARGGHRRPAARARRQWERDRGRPDGRRHAARIGLDLGHRDDDRLRAGAAGGARADVALARARA